MNSVFASRFTSSPSKLAGNSEPIPKSERFMMPPIWNPADTFLFAVLVYVPVERHV